MIALMRKLIHNNTYKILLWVFLFMMAVGSGIFIDFNSSRGWVIKTYNQKMSDQKFQKMIYKAKSMQEYFKQKGIVFGKEESVEKEVLQASISDLLRSHVSNQLSLTVPSYVIDKTLHEQLGRLPSHFFKANGELNQEVFEKEIAPQTIDEYISDLYETTKHKLLDNIVDLAIYTPSFELDMQYKSDFASKEYSIVSLSLQKFINKSKENAPSDAKLEAFYKKNKNNDLFKSKEKRAGIAWTFSQKDYGIKVTDSEAKSFYDKNKQVKYLTSPSQVQIRSLVLTIAPGKEEETKKKIEELKDQADKNPQDFAKLVREFSQDKETASKGGLSDLFDQSNKEIDKTVIKTAFESLSKDGQISSPIKTDKGYEIIQRVKRSPAQYQDFKSVEASIKKELEEEKFKKRFKQDATRVITQMKYDPEAFDAFVSRHKGVKKDISLDVRKGGLEAAELFKTDELRTKNFFNGDNGVIIQCTKIEKSTALPLSQVKQKVLGLYHEEQGKHDLEAALSTALTEAQQSGLSKIAKNYETTIDSASFEFKNGKVNQSTILQTPAVQKAVKSLYSPGAITSAMTDSEGLLIKLNSVDKENGKLFEEKRDQLTKTAFYAKKHQVKDGFVASLYRHAKLNNKIEIKDEILHLVK